MPPFTVVTAPVTVPVSHDRQSIARPLPFFFLGLASRKWARSFPRHSSELDENGLGSLDSSSPDLLRPPLDGGDFKVCYSCRGELRTHRWDSASELPNAGDHEAERVVCYWVFGWNRLCFGVGLGDEWRRWWRRWWRLWWISMGLMGEGNSVRSSKGKVSVEGSGDAVGGIDCNDWQSRIRMSSVAVIAWTPEGGTFGSGEDHGVLPNGPKGP
ncbi:hypothetical protein V6N11_082380 [Hibiscus sabdariffa]|uniref:Uncharacterized protein n=1 Tax=Hibiscus sabdariffa TaxID=183260 RepID=A0ABR2PCG2_9ROSI